MARRRQTASYAAWSKKKRRRRLRWGRLFLTLIVLVVIVFGLRLGLSEDFRLRMMQNVAALVSEQRQQTETMDGALAADDATVRYTTVAATERLLHSGDLILVNYQYAYDFALNSDVELIDLSTAINDSYSVYGTVYVQPKMAEALNQLAAAFAEATGNTDVRVISGYRSEEYQQQLYDAKVEEVGAEQAAVWAAEPGYSEHHTGLAVDVGIASGSGALAFTDQGTYAWYCDNAANYGLINRYAEEKQEITKIMDEPWHYRYVGKPHALLITQNNLCLEEYIEMLKNYNFFGQHLTLSVSADENYEIYYVSGSRSDIPVPKNRRYEISGNNVDGYIVTVHLNETV